MAYEGVGVDGGSSNGLAVSQDGLEGLDKTWLAEVGSPVVKRFIGNNGRKVVAHVVRTMEGRLINIDTSDSIGLAVSSNGIHCSVYWLYNMNKWVKCLSKSLPGLACSQDSRNWARIEGIFTVELC
ncbi:hypothetical protein L3X38_020562 [Prunus dulcis]|uniref:Uncharacterized protein n=1 Tax=Prunus dulcis TaxID=3755 RepID=A0AAD4ZDL6_PRUDU|nr:hypothetical protein L3X38_020562 [Prunus dulcis]